MSHAGGFARCGALDATAAGRGGRPRMGGATFDGPVCFPGVSTFLMCHLDRALAGVQLDPLILILRKQAVSQQHSGMSQIAVMQVPSSVPSGPLPLVPVTKASLARFQRSRAQHATLTSP